MTNLPCAGSRAAYKSLPANFCGPIGTQIIPASIVARSQPSLAAQSAVAIREPPTVKQSRAMDGVFPEALQSLREADPEVFSIIEDEKKRQW